MITIEHLTPSPSLPPGAYMSAETKYDLEREGVPPHWTYEPLTYRGQPVTLHEGVPANTLWVVGDAGEFRGAAAAFAEGASALVHVLPHDATWGVPVHKDARGFWGMSTLDYLSDAELAEALSNPYSYSLADFQPLSKAGRRGAIAGHALQLRSLDAACARAMGWTRNALGDAWETLEGGWVGCEQWNPTVDPTAARLLEDWVEAHGLEARYIDALIEIVNQDGDGSNPVGWIDWDERGSITLWPLAHATPAQRARAFVEVVWPHE